MSFSGQLASLVQNAATSLLSEPCMYLPDGLAPVYLKGVWTNPDITLDENDQPIQANPVIDLKLADLPREPITELDRITVNGFTYRLIETINDGQGMVKCILNRIID